VNQRPWGLPLGGIKSSLEIVCFQVLCMYDTYMTTSQPTDSVAYLGFLKGRPRVDGARVEAL